MVYIGCEEKIMRSLRNINRVSITGAGASTSATGHLTACSSVVERSLDKGGVAGSNPAPRTDPMNSILRWRSTDVSTNVTLTGGALVSGVVSKTALGGSDSHATCNSTPMNTPNQQQRERQRQQRQIGAVTARFTDSSLSV